VERTTIISKLKNYISDEILDGRDAGLDAHTPLLEWGIINSLEIARLATFIHSCFDVELPEDRLIASNLRDLTSIAGLILDVRKQFLAE